MNLWFSCLWTKIRIGWQSSRYCLVQQKENSNYSTN